MSTPDPAPVRPPHPHAPFWARLTRKAGTWAAVGAIATNALDVLEGEDLTDNVHNHVWVSLAAAALRILIGLVASKTSRTADPDG